MYNGHINQAVNVRVKKGNKAMAVLYQVRAVAGIVHYAIKFM
jgi:hypothetical protein